MAEDGRADPGPVTSRRTGASPVWPAQRRGAVATGWLIAAVLTVATIAGVVVLLHQPFRATGVRAGDPLVAENSHQWGVPEPTRSLAVSPVQKPAAPPKALATWSVSNAGSGTVFDLGGASCGTDTCPTLLRSSDDGSSWRQVHIFTGTDTAALEGSQVPVVQPDRGISEVRFVTPRVGFVFGGSLWMTTDGGASFTQLPHLGTTVLAVEMWQQSVVVVSADGCAQGECTGPLHIGELVPGTSSETGTPAEITLSESIKSATVTPGGGAAFVETIGHSGSPTVHRYDGTKATTVRSPRACAGEPLGHLAAAANRDEDGKRAIFGLCPQDFRGGRQQFTVVSSEDDGVTWTRRSDRLSLPRVGRVSTAALESDDLIVSAGGPRAGSGIFAPGPGTLQRSADGGRTFVSAASGGIRAADTLARAALLDTAGFDWVGVSGQVLYAVPRNTSSYLVSSDRGRTWRTVDPTASK